MTTTAPAPTTPNNLDAVFEVLYNPQAAAHEILNVLKKNKNKIVKEYRDLLGAAVELLDDKETIEIRRNPNGHVFIQQLGQEERDSGIIIDDLAATQLGTLISAVSGLEFTRNTPSLEFILPFHGARFSIMSSPVGSSPMFAIRKRIGRTIYLDEYRHNKQISDTHFKLLEQYVAANKNILIVAPQRAGKTTFAQALLTYVYQMFPSTLFAIIEDTPELNVPTTNKYEWLTQERIGFDFARLIKHSLRYGAPSLSIGEVRAQPDSLIEGWTTGSERTGIATIHGLTAAEGMYRLEQLYAKENKTVDRSTRRFFKQSIGAIVVLEPARKGGKPQIKDVTHIEAISATDEYRFYRAA